MRGRPSWLRGLALLAACAGLLPAARGEAADRGKQLFDARCVACHSADGAGTPGLAPPLAHALPSLGGEAGRAYVAKVLTHGLSGRIVSQGQAYVGAMPAQADLSDDDLAAVASYVASALNGLPQAGFTAADLARARAMPATHKELREERAALAP